MNFDIMAFASSKIRLGGKKAYFNPAIYPNNKYFDCEGRSKFHLDIFKKDHNEGYTLSLKSSNMSENLNWPYAEFICSFGRKYEGNKQNRSELDGYYREHSISNDTKNNRNDDLKLDRKRHHFRPLQKAHIHIFKLIVKVDIHGYYVVEGSG